MTVIVQLDTAGREAAYRALRRLAMEDIEFPSLSHQETKIAVAAVLKAYHEAMGGWRPQP